MIRRKFLKISRVHAEQDAAARLGASLGGRNVVGIHDSEIALDSADFGVEARTGIESDLGDEVRSERRSAELQVALIQLRARQAGQVVGQGDGGTAGVAADILVRVLGRESEGHGVARMIEHPITGLASPSQARHVIHVEDLRVEDVARQRRRCLCGSASACSSFGRPEIPSLPFRASTQ